MKLHQFFLDSKKSKAQIAREIGAHQVLVSQWSALKRPRPVPVERCARLEAATGGKVMRWDLRPNDWWQIWPELIDHPDAPPIPKSSVSSIPDGLIPNPQGLGGFSSEVQRG